MGYSVSSEIRPAAGRTAASRLLIATISAVALLGVAVGAAQAASLAGTPIDWNQPQKDCSGPEASDLNPGEMLWYFVLTGPDRSEGNLVVTFQSAPEEAIPGVSADAQMHFLATTNHPETLLSASTLGVDGESLTLSHVCYMQIADPSPEPSSGPTASPPPTSTPTPTPKATPKPTPRPTPDPTPSPSPTPAPTARPTPRPTPPSTDDSTPVPEPSPAATSEPTPSAQPTVSPTATRPAEPIVVQAPSPAATDEPQSTPEVTEIPERQPEPEASQTPLAAIVLSTTNEPPASTGLDPIFLVVAGGLLIGLLTLLVALRGSLRRGALERVLG